MSIWTRWASREFGSARARRMERRLRGTPRPPFRFESLEDRRLLTITTGFSLGMLAWGTTLEPAASPGIYGVINVQFLQGNLLYQEYEAMTSTCSFIQSDGSGFGICKSCRTGALSGSKK